MIGSVGLGSGGSDFRVCGILDVEYRFWSTF